MFVIPASNNHVASLWNSPLFTDTLDFLTALPEESTLPSPPSPSPLPLLLCDLPANRMSLSVVCCNGDDTVVTHSTIDDQVSATPRNTPGVNETPKNDESCDEPSVRLHTFTVTNTTISGKDNNDNDEDTDKSGQKNDRMEGVPDCASTMDSNASDSAPGSDSGNRPGQASPSGFSSPDEELATMDSPSFRKAHTTSRPAPAKRRREGARGDDLGHNSTHTLMFLSEEGDLSSGDVVALDDNIRILRPKRPRSSCSFNDVHVQNNGVDTMSTGDVGIGGGVGAVSQLAKASTAHPHHHNHPSVHHHHHHHHDLPPPPPPPPPPHHHHHHDPSVGFDVEGGLSSWPLVPSAEMEANLQQWSRDNDHSSGQECDVVHSATIQGYRNNIDLDNDPNAVDPNSGSTSSIDSSLAIPPDRLDAAVSRYQLLNMTPHLTQVPMPSMTSCLSSTDVFSTDHAVGSDSTSTAHNADEGRAVSSPTLPGQDVDVPSSGRTRDASRQDVSTEINKESLYPSDEELDECENGRARETLRKWYWRVRQLVEYKEQFGNMNVPQQYAKNRSLGIFVNKTRSNRAKIKGRKLAVLEGLGFDWGMKKGDDAWRLRFGELNEYTLTHGNCNIPTKYKANPALGRWVSTQRSHYKKKQEGKRSPLTEEQIDLLEGVGFVWKLT